MIVKKIITTAIDVDDPVGIYADFETNVLGILASKFEGKCFRCSYVKKVIGIRRVSECYITQDGAPSYGTINVQFEAEVIVFAVGEVIVNATVRKKDKKTIIASTEICSIIMANNDAILASVAVNQMIPVRVAAVRYSYGARTVSVSAVPFTFSSAVTIYELSPLSAEDKAYIDPAVERVKDAEHAAEALRTRKPKAWDFFRSLLYAYASPVAIPADAREVDMFTSQGNPFASITAPVYVSRDSRLDLSRPVIYAFSKAETAQRVPNSQLASGVANMDVALTLIEDYCAHLRMIIEMAEAYADDRLESHTNIWLILKRQKLRV